MLNCAGIDNPWIKALIGVALLVLGLAVHGVFFIIVGALLAAWGVVGVAGRRLGCER